MQAATLEPRHDLSKSAPFRIALIVLLSGDLVLTPEHLGPAYLAAVLRRAGAQVTIYEVPLERDDEALGKVSADHPDLVGISITTVAIDQARSFGERLRVALGPDVFLLAGGPVATHLGVRLLRIGSWHFLDGLIRGEGEVPLLRLAEALHAGQSLMEVPNLCYRKGAEIHENVMQRAIENLDELPFPARDQLKMRNGKLSYVRLSTSRGCTAHCTFCNAPHTRNRVGPASKAWRGLSPERVVDEIEMLVSTYGCKTFDFVDSTFEDPGGDTIGKQRVRSIAEGILARELNIYFNICIQAVNWTEKDRSLIELLWQAGLEKVLIGVEAGNNAGLRRWQKRSTVADNIRAIRLLREAGVYVAFGFISFHPWSNFEEVRIDQEFLRDNLGYNLRRFTTRLELYPGSEVITQLDAEGMLEADFHETLNPFGYYYQDPRIGVLANCLNTLYGMEYVESCRIREEPSVFRFETYDIVLHNFTSRLARRYPDDTVVRDELNMLNAEVVSIKAHMTRFNFELIQEFTERAEREVIRTEDALNLAPKVESFYMEKMRQIERAKLRCGLKLRRQGLDLAALSGSLS